MSVKTKSTITKLFAYSVGILTVTLSASSAFAGGSPHGRCVGTNSFLDQVNILSISNTDVSSGSYEILMRDSGGNPLYADTITLEPKVKKDFLLSELGLTPNSIGTLCVESVTAFRGGLTTYRPQESSDFGSAFDFAVYYPFKEAKSGSTSVALNTFRLGVPDSYNVANWISISDIDAKDSLEINGRIDYFDDFGGFIGAQSVKIPNGGRVDFPAHEILSGSDNAERIGSARFSPELLSNGGTARFTLISSRYTYDLATKDFRSAFSVPVTSDSALNTTKYGSVSPLKNEVSTIEMVNSSFDASRLDVSVQNALGTTTSSIRSSLPSLSSRHLVFTDQSAGSFSLEASFVDGANIFYALDDFGALLYATATELQTDANLITYSEYNTFLGSSNSGELFNGSSDKSTVEIQAIDFKGTTVFQETFEIASGERNKFALELPENSYGTLTITSDQTSVFFSNTITKDGEFSLRIPATN